MVKRTLQALLLLLLVVSTVMSWSAFSQLRNAAAEHHLASFSPDHSHDHSHETDSPSHRHRHAPEEPEHEHPHAHPGACASMADSGLIPSPQTGPLLESGFESLALAIFSSPRILGSAPALRPPIA